MSTTVKPRITRVEIEFNSATGDPRIRIYSRRIIEETGEEDIFASVSAEDIVAPATAIDGFLAWLLVQAKLKFNRDDLEFE
jgi:hypothetical protein